MNMPRLVRRAALGILALVLLLAPCAHALPAGWYMVMTETDAKLYDENSIRRWHGWVDANGDWHEEKRIVGGGDSGGGVFGDVGVGAGTLDVQLLAAAASLEISDLRGGGVTLHVQSGPFAAYQSVSLPLLATPGGQLVAALDAGGGVLDTLVIWPPTCSGLRIAR